MKREVMGARKARELLAKLGYPTFENAIAILRDGSGFDVTPYDFKVADAIWGPDIASRRKDNSIKVDGPRCHDRSANSTAATVTGDRHHVYRPGQHASRCVLSPRLTLDRTVSGKPSRAAEPVKKSMDVIISTLRSRNFIVSAIYSDGEGAIGKIKPQLNMLGIEVDISGAGGYVARIERRIRVI
jgi:hypothetical protein